MRMTKIMSSNPPVLRPTMQIIEADGGEELRLRPPRTSSDNREPEEDPQLSLYVNRKKDVICFELQLANIMIVVSQQCACARSRHSMKRVLPDSRSRRVRRMQKRCPIST